MPVFPHTTEPWRRFLSLLCGVFALEVETLSLLPVTQCWLFSQVKGVNFEAVLRVEEEEANPKQNLTKREAEEDLGLSMLIDSQNNRYILTKPRDATIPRADHHFLKVACLSSPSRSPTAPCPLPGVRAASGGALFPRVTIGRATFLPTDSSLASVFL